VSQYMNQAILLVDINTGFSILAQIPKTTLEKARLQCLNILQHCIIGQMYRLC